MSDKPEVQQSEEERHSETRSLSHMVRRALLAAVGAIAISRDEMEHLVNRLVERGAIAEREGRQLLREVIERRRRQADKPGEKVEGDVDSRVEQLLNRLNIPTRRDIEELSDRIAQLSERVEELKRLRAHH